MADELGSQGLSGIEIINDLLAQIKKRLERDCNLRPSDSYSRGYSAKVTYHVECYGLDTSTVDAEVVVGTQKDDPDSDIDEGVLDIEQEVNIQKVRDRIENAGNAQEEMGGEEDEKEPEQKAIPPVMKRKYNKKVDLIATVTGGAQDFKE